MIPEREREALMRLTMCAREECRICMYQKRCDFDFQYKLATKNMNILADALRADRKTEPQTCEECEHWNDTEDGCADRHGCKTENSSEKPNNSLDKDINVRSKDEPQTEDDKKHCVFCKWVYELNVCGRCRNMNLFADAIEDEPQTERTTTEQLIEQLTEQPQMEGSE